MADGLRGQFPKLGRRRERGEVSHTGIDTEARWTKSGWHGRASGWKLHIISTVAAVWRPPAAALTLANADDAEAARPLLDELPAEVQFLLGDRHANTPAIRQNCRDDGRILVASRPGRHPHADGGVAVRRVFHTLRSAAIEHVNEHLKGMFDGHGPVSTRGHANTARFALGAVFVYHLALLRRYEHGLSLNTGLKAFLKAASCL